MSNELSIFEAMGGTYRSVDGILYPNISVGDSDDTVSIPITDVGKYGLIWISSNVPVTVSSYLYPVITGISGNRLKTSSFVSAILSAFWHFNPYRLATASNGPTRRGRPVAAPYSPPAFRRASIQFSDIAFSATNGPAPTHVEYAFNTPTT